MVEVWFRGGTGSVSPELTSLSSLWAPAAPQEASSCTERCCSSSPSSSTSWPSPSPRWSWPSCWWWLWPSRRGTGSWSWASSSAWPVTSPHSSSCTSSSVSKGERAQRETAKPCSGRPADTSRLLMRVKRCVSLQQHLFTVNWTLGRSRWENWRVVDHIKEEMPTFRSVSCGPPCFCAFVTTPAPKTVLINLLVSVRQKQKHKGLSQQKRRVYSWSGAAPQPPCWLAANWACKEKRGLILVCALWRTVTQTKVQPLKRFQAFIFSFMWNAGFLFSAWAAVHGWCVVRCSLRLRAGLE